VKRRKVKSEEIRVKNDKSQLILLGVGGKINRPGINRGGSLTRYGLKLWLRHFCH
jgi:hypothetical protein